MDVVTNVTSHSTIPTETGNAVALITMFLTTTTVMVTIMVTDMVIIMSDITDMVTDIIIDQKTERILTIQLIEDVAMMVKRMLTEESFITAVKRSTKRVSSSLHTLIATIPTAPATRNLTLIQATTIIIIMVTDITTDMGTVIMDMITITMITTTMGTTTMGTTITTILRCPRRPWSPPRTWTWSLS